MAEVSLLNATKRFGDVTAVDNVSLTIADGEFVVLLGPTGAGKTTTLRLIAGLEPLDAGSVRIAGHDVSGDAPAMRDVAFVFQQYSLYPHLSVYDNMAFPLRSPTRRVPEDEIRRTIQEIARMLHIDHKLQNKATRLSGGEMQRVAIGRALVRQPSIYLMDEPLSSLDAKLRQELRLELKRIQRDLGATVLYVTHDQVEAMTMASRIGVLKEGRLVQLGTPREIYEDPAETYVATRLGQPRINLVPRGLFPDVPAPTRVETIGVRTEHLKIDRHHQGKAKVARIEHLGDHRYLHLNLDGQPIVTLADHDTDLDVGDNVALRLEQPLFFDREGQRVRA
ncbi:MAG TPA: ABC transporter ATP-binding protein [Dongiaceae bacterium]|jgi:multiple sugar transport system ATP-binding protein|nr:ABC transporter ATP-binding protein [Dongiaceae bacterium]